MYGFEWDGAHRFSDADLDRPCASCGVMVGDHPANQEYCRGSRIRVASPSPPLVVRQGLKSTRTRVISKTSIPTEFVPRHGNDTSDSLFQPGTTTKASPVPRRFINQDDANEFLIYTDGCCLNNGQANPRAGCSAVFRPPTRTRQYYGRVSFALENRGPTGEPHPQTSNRAELRAVIAALRFRSWAGEGFSSLVIATDSTYVVKGSTDWIWPWMHYGWETRAGTPVKNQDLWLCLFAEIEKAYRSRLSIKFWHIPRGWNEVADFYAKEGAETERRDHFTDLVSPKD
ncbi:hypothetical protein PENARI_c012G08290 [Penicillium arizonense]|uniref:ribonuclease H n=1 Tax=Penicillium arizonense TaxID=1835702 RepID=A0A1F5LFT4_PENAI|nr:hypothetical protein PENARI_c012G08290 [Penicillium arizonense]OGE51759.1 hypothetical protein PENARI_c012G08290 [Penicillium arizonense]